MKNISAALLSIVLFFGVSAAAFADDASDDLEAFKNFLDSDELTAVIEQTRDDSLVKSFGYTGVSARYGNDTVGYKEYNALYSDFLDRLANGTAVGELVSDEYIWVVSSGKIKVDVSINDKGEWYARRVGTLLDELIESGVVDGSVRFDQVNSAIERIGRTNVKDVICVNLPGMYVRFVCLVSDTTFVMPFTPNPDFMGFENGKMYTASEADKIWNEYVASIPVCHNAEIINGRDINDLTVEELLSLEYGGTNGGIVTNIEPSPAAKNGIPVAVILIAPVVCIGAGIAVMMLVWNKRGKKRGK